MDSKEEKDISPVPLAPPPASGESSKILKVISDFFSGLFLPLLVPTYAFAMALWVTPLAVLPEQMRFLSAVIIFLITTLPPLVTILFLMRKGKVKDVAINDPKDRPIPYLVTIICYFIAAFFIRKWPHWLPMFFTGAAFTAIIASLITFKWKISAHVASMGGLTALLIYVGIHHIAVVMIIPWIAVAVFCSGAVGSARVYLGRHTPAQVYAGWALGLIVTYIFMCL